MLEPNTCLFIDEFGGDGVLNSQSSLSRFSKFELPKLLEYYSIHNDYFEERLNFCLHMLSKQKSIWTRSTLMSSKCCLLSACIHKLTLNEIISASSSKF